LRQFFFRHCFVTIAFVLKRLQARSSHGSFAAASCLCLSFAGCGKYADFTLPRLEGSGNAAIRLQLAPDPVIPRGDAHDALNPSVVFHGGELYNYFSEFDGRTWHTVLTTSSDGLNWRRQGRVLSPDPNTWERDYIAANGSAIFDSGEWLYWYQSGDHEAPEIGLARSKDGRHWTKEPKSVLSTGPRGSWDERGVGDPYVLKLDGWFYIYYLGQNRARQQQLGVARSRDGVNWTKLRSNPVLEIPWPGSQKPDENGLGEPSVWAADGWYWMIYTGRDARERRSLITARSSNGVHWTRGASFSGDQPWDREVVCDPTVVVNGEKTRFWFGGGDKARPDENLNGQIGVGEVIRQ
jgi:predicted GH43/DUF377 family glycosyl hydrolase